MYIPRQFAVSAARALDLVDEVAFGLLIAPDAGGGDLELSHLPFLLERDAGPHGALRTHVARGNPIWRAAERGSPLTAVFSGPHAYVSASWYERPAEQVPTWNYAVAHVHGRARGLMPTADLERLVRDLSARFEPARAWHADLLDPGDLRGMLAGIVGFTIEIERIEGKFKLSQNRSPADRARVIAGLEARGGEGDAGLAGLMRGVGEAGG